MTKRAAREPQSSQPITVADILNGTVKEGEENITHLMVPSTYQEEETIFDDEEAENDNDIIRILAETGGLSEQGAFVNIYRIGEDKIDTYLMKVTPKEFSLDLILQKYGTGRYRAMGYAPRKTGGGVSRFMNRVVQVEAPKLDALKEDKTEQLLIRMQEQNQQFMQQVLSSVKPQQNQNTDVIGLLKIAKDLFQPANAVPAVDPMAQMTQMLTMFKLMKDNFGDGGGGETNLMSKALEILGPSLTKGLEQQMLNAQNNQGAQSPENTPLLTHQGEPVMNQNISPEIQKLNANIQRLVVAAQKNSNVEVYAELILEEINNDDEAMTLVSDPQAWSFIMAQPGVADNKLWFERLRETIKEFLTSDENEAISKKEDTGDNPKNVTGQL